MGKDRHEEAERKSSGKGASGWETVWVDFTPLDVEQVKIFGGAEDSSFWPMLAAHIEAGWRVSFNWSEHFGAVVGAASCNEAGHPCYQQSLLVRHSDPTKCGWMVAYVLTRMVDAEGGFHRTPSVVDAW